MGWSEAQEIPQRREDLCMTMMIACLANRVVNTWQPLMQELDEDDELGPAASIVIGFIVLIHPTARSSSALGVSLHDDELIVNHVLQRVGVPDAHAMEPPTVPETLKDLLLVQVPLLGPREHELQPVHNRLQRNPRQMLSQYRLIETPVNGYEVRVATALLAKDVMEHALKQGFKVLGIKSFESVNDPLPPHWIQFMGRAQRQLCVGGLGIVKEPATFILRHIW